MSEMSEVFSTCVKRKYGILGRPSGSVLKPIYQIIKDRNIIEKNEIKEALTEYRGQDDINSEHLEGAIKMFDLEGIPETIVDDTGKIADLINENVEESLSFKDKKMAQAAYNLYKKLKTCYDKLEDKSGGGRKNKKIQMKTKKKKKKKNKKGGGTEIYLDEISNNKRFCRENPGEGLFSRRQPRIKEECNELNPVCKWDYDKKEKKNRCMKNKEWLSENTDKYAHIYRMKPQTNRRDRRSSRRSSSRRSRRDRRSSRDSGPRTLEEFNREYEPLKLDGDTGVEDPFASANRMLAMDVGKGRGPVYQPMGLYGMQMGTSDAAGRQLQDPEVAQYLDESLHYIGPPKKEAQVSFHGDKLIIR